MDVFGGEIRRRDVFPLLVLHLIAQERQYGNRLIEEIERITEGVISANPNTIYPLLRELEAQGMIKGDWEHPDRRTRRYYSITAAGRRELRRLLASRRRFGPGDDPVQGRGLKPHACLRQESRQAGGAQLPDRGGRARALSDRPHRAPVRA